MPRAETKYAWVGDRAVAYQVHGEGPVDLLVVTGPASNVEVLWEWPQAAHALERLGRFARVIRFDRGGTGLSDPMDEPPTLENQVDDLLAVLDAADAGVVALTGLGEAARLCMYVAAAHPDRARALVVVGGSGASMLVTREDMREWFERVSRNAWPAEELASLYGPSHADDPEFLRFLARWVRTSAGPTMTRRLMALSVAFDVTDALPSIRVPALILHRTGDLLFPIEMGRALGDQIPDAVFKELPGTDSWPWVGDTDAWVDEIEEFLTGTRPVAPTDRILATLLFTDIVGSTDRAATLGDQRWRELLASHDRAVRRQLARFGGNEVKSLGDGFLATFDSPARGIRCAEAIRSATAELGLEVRAGLHTGECELLENDVGGIAVHIAARIGAMAGAGEVLVSGTVADLVVGSGFTFDDRGSHDLKGVPGNWRVAAVEPSGAGG